MAGSDRGSFREAPGCGRSRDGSRDGDPSARRSIDLTSGSGTAIVRTHRVSERRPPVIGRRDGSLCRPGAEPTPLEGPYSTARTFPRVEPRSVAACRSLAPFLAGAGRRHRCAPFAGLIGGRQWWIARGCACHGRPDADRGGGRGPERDASAVRGGGVIRRMTVAGHPAPRVFSSLGRPGAAAGGLVDRRDHGGRPGAVSHDGRTRDTAARGWIACEGTAEVSRFSRRSVRLRDSEERHQSRGPAVPKDSGASSVASRQTRGDRCARRTSAR